MADIRKFRFEDIREFKDLSKDGSTFVVVKPVKPISEEDPNLDFVSFDPQAAQALAAIWAAKTGEVDLEVRPPKEGKKSPTLHWPRKGGGGGGYRGKSEAELAQEARIAALAEAVKVLTCSPSLWGVPLEQVPEHILKTAKQFLPFIQGGTTQPAPAAPKPPGPGPVKPNNAPAGDPEFDRLAAEAERERQAAKGAQPGDSPSAPTLEELLEAAQQHGLNKARLLMLANKELGVTDLSKMTAQQRNELAGKLDHLQSAGAGR